MSFMITVQVNNLDDAFDIYGRVLCQKCQGKAGKARLSTTIDGESRILSNDTLKTFGQTYGGNYQIHPVQ